MWETYNSSLSNSFFRNETWDFLSKNETFLDLDGEADFNSTFNNSTVNIQEIMEKLQASQKIPGINLNNVDGDDDNLSIMLDILSFGPPSISGFWSSLAKCSLLVFIYYIPRMIYFRCTRFTSDIKKKGFLLIIFLSFLGCAGGAAHFLSFQEDMQGYLKDASSLDLENNKTETATIAPISPENMMYHQIVIRTLNRAVSPILLMVVVQQYLLYNNTQISEPFQNSIIQFFICIIIILILGIATFLGSSASFALDPTQAIYNLLDIDANFYDILFPFIVGIIFHLVKSKIQKRMKYTAGEELISYMDRVNKVIVYQFVMSLVAIAAYFLRDIKSNSVSDSALHFFVAAHTPVVHAMLLRSLLRSNAPRRICFLLICSTEQQITAEQIVQPAIQMTEKQAEDTQETLDHNKSIQIKMG